MMYEYWLDPEHWYSDADENAEVEEEQEYEF